MSEKLSEENAAILRPLGALFTPVEQAEMFILSAAQVNMILDAARSEALSRRPDAPRADTGWMPIETAPPPPWPAGSATNCKRDGWAAFFAGRGREDCPFPPGRSDLQRGYREGWDAAAALPAPPQADGAQE